MSRQSLARVHYFDRQFLRTDDFVDEQAYHLSMRRRHNIGHHTWGIVSGLELVLDEAGRPAVEPGLAVDGYGRELVQEARSVLNVGAFDEIPGDELEVWIVYDRVAADPAPPGYAPPEDSEAFYRWRERPIVRVGKPGAAPFEPRRPSTVDNPDYGPSQPSVDEPSDDWPVFLGRIHRRLEDDGPVYIIDTVGRPYAGLVGAVLESPAEDGVRLELGGDEAAARFAIVLPKSESGEGEPDEGESVALSIDGDGTVEVPGRLVVDGDLEVLDGALELSVLAEAPTAPPDARPWSLYRVGVDGGEELRLEMGRGAGALVVGSFSPETKQFEPILEVSADGGVTIHGDLQVTGQVVDASGTAPQRGAARFTDEAEQLLLSNFVSGVNTSTGILEGIPQAVSAVRDRPVIRSADVPQADALVSAVDELALDPARVEDLARLLLERGDLAQRLREKLEEEM